PKADSVGVGSRRQWLEPTRPRKRPFRSEPDRNGLKRHRVAGVERHALTPRESHALFVYSIVIAPVGHSSTHAPQSMHSSESTTATSPSIVIASEGHTSTQEPHPEQE